MDEIYTVGIRLALDNGVSAGLATIRRDLEEFDRAAARTLAGLSRRPDGVASGARGASDMARATAAVARTHVGEDGPATDDGGERRHAVPRSAGPAQPTTQAVVPPARVWTAPDTTRSAVSPVVLAASPVAPGDATPARPADRNAARPTVGQTPAPASRPSVAVSIFSPRIGSPPRGDTVAPDRAAATPRRSWAGQDPAAFSPSQSGGSMPPPPRSGDAPPAPPPAAAVTGRLAASVAPIPAAAWAAGRATDPGGGSPLPAAPPAPSAPAAGGGPVGGDVYLDGARMGRWIADRLGRDAERPQAGMTQFDGRMGRPWPGALQGG